MAVPFAVRFEACSLAVCEYFSRSGEHAAASPCSVLAVKIRGLNLHGSGYAARRRSVSPRLWRQRRDRAHHCANLRHATKGPKVVTDALPISRFPVPDLANMPEDIRNRILAVQEKSGFIPNVFLVLAHRPDEFRAFFAYHDALMERPGNLTKVEREPPGRRSAPAAPRRCRRHPPRCGRAPVSPRPRAPQSAARDRRPDNSKGTPPPRASNRAARGVPLAPARRCIRHYSAGGETFRD